MYWDEVLAFDDERVKERTTQFVIQRELEQGPRHAAAQPPLIKRIGNMLLGTEGQTRPLRTAIHRPISAPSERLVQPETVTETHQPVVKTASVTMIVNPVVRSETAPKPVAVSAANAASLFGIVSELLAETVIPQQTSPEASGIAVDPMERLEEVFDD